MNQILVEPYRIPRPYEREMAALDPALFKPIPPALQPIWPMLKAIYRRTKPREPEKRVLTSAPEPDDYLTAEEAARYVGVHVKTLLKWVRLGVFPRIPLPGKGKDYRFSKALIDEWARNRTLGRAK
jgi:excisionase family DNA binding protein